MVVAGLDVNGTGVLDEDEIEDTRYICDPEDVRPGERRQGPSLQIARVPTATASSKR